MHRNSYFLNCPVANIPIEIAQTPSPIALNLIIFLKYKCLIVSIKMHDMNIELNKD